MDWTEEFKFSLKKGAAKKGRRNASTTSNSQQSPEESLGLDLDLSMDTLEAYDSKIEPKKRISGGWADTGGRSTRTLQKNVFEDEQLLTSTTSVGASDDGIPVIPDIDDMQENSLADDTAMPPSVSVKRVITLKELNSELLGQQALVSLGDLDLSLLTKHLLPESALEEPDENWEWEKLFTEVVAEINTEKVSVQSPKKSNEPIST